MYLLKEKIYSDDLDENGIATFLNPYSYLFFRTQKEAFKSFDKIYIDGILLVLLLRMWGIRTKRASFDMTSMAPSVFGSSVEKKKNIYFIGSTEENLTGFLAVVRANFPELKISGYRNGYFKNKEERQKVLSSILELKPDKVVVGMGTPNQENFLCELKNMGWKGVGYTCGGFIHQTAKGMNYYPKFYNEYNLRWLYRIFDEPKLFKRYSFYYPLSVCLFTFDAIRYKFNH
ncbi:WecB/TagA/CpsF family glycosyltransferase [Flagellimonas lutimaris]|uniref:WecB/TagA/CpsF family glycosyltransferase n=1 Tax=Flagellimonas lutimaris TaxID=475082 RepID=UPI003F5CC590